MWVCHCNAFNDKALDRAIVDVKGAMTARGEPADKRPKISEVYRHASNGNRPNCGTCLGTIKDHIDAFMTKEAKQQGANTANASGRWNPLSSDPKQRAAITAHAPAHSDFQSSGCENCTCGRIHPDAPRP